MKKYNLLNGILVTMIAAMFILSSCTGKPADKLKGARPNIVFILADDMGWADLPVYGNKFNEAPNLTAMAENGMQFTNAYAACPVCSPTRASIMSGQYPARVGITDFITGHWRPYEEVIVPKNRTQYLPLEIYTLGEAMKDAGYATGYFGKWHLGGGEYYPKNQGFDISNVYQGGGFFHYADRMEVPMDTKPGVVLSEALTDLGLDFIDRHQAEPFFLQVSYNAVHSPLQGAHAYMEKFKDIEDIQRRIFAAMLANMDSSVGDVMQKLKECGLEENTLVIFFSDNGGPTLELTSSNAPLRGGKGSMFEGGLRIPFMMQWKERLPGGLEYEHAVSSLDLFPTCAAAAQAEIPENLDGVNLLPFLLGETNEIPHEILFWRQGVRTALRKGDWKIVFDPSGKSWELYNLAEDLTESRDLSARDPEKRDDLIEKWRSLNKEMVDPMF